MIQFEALERKANCTDQSKKSDVIDAATPDKIATISDAEKAENALMRKVLELLGTEDCLVSTLLPPPTPPKPSMLQQIIREAREARMMAARGETTSTAKAPKKSAPPIVLPTRWRDLTPAQRYLAAIRSALKSDGAALTLNLSQKVEKSAATAPDPVRYLSGLINRALKGAGLAGTPYSFMLDVSAAGRLHIHGAIIFDPATDPALVKRALMKAGGKFQGRTASRQTLLRNLTDAEGWAAYCAKAERQTRKVLSGERLVFVSTPMTKIAKQHHEDVTTPAPVTAQTISAPTSGKAPAPRPVRVMVRRRPYKTHTRLLTPSGTLTHPGKPKPVSGACMRRLSDHGRGDHRSTPVMPPG